MNRLYLVRHGENIANLTLEFSYHRVDYSLTSKGVLQAEQTAEYLHSAGIQEVYSSPLKRALETAQIIAAPLGLPVIVLENFREVNVGELEGQKPTAELWKQHNAVIADWMDGHPETRFPGGEDFFTLADRTRAGFEQVLSGKEGRTILIVAHGGVFSFPLRTIVAGMDDEVIAQGVPNCSVTELAARLMDGRVDARLVRYAYAGHLHGEAANLVTGLPGVSELSQAK